MSDPEPLPDNENSDLSRFTAESLGKLKKEERSLHLALIQIHRINFTFIRFFPIEVCYNIKQSFRCGYGSTPIHFAGFGSTSKKRRYGSKWLRHFIFQNITFKKKDSGIFLFMWLEKPQKC